jgi:MerR HTH family regulatory protein
MPKLFSTREAAQASGARPRALSTWLDRALIPSRRPGSGAPRAFSRADILRIALLHRLTLLGVAPLRASTIAGEHSGKSGFLIIEPGAAHVAPRQELTLSPYATVIDLDAVKAEVDSRIAAVAA